MTLDQPSIATRTASTESQGATYAETPRYLPVLLAVGINCDSLDGEGNG